MTIRLIAALLLLSLVPNCSLAQNRSTQNSTSQSRTALTESLDSYLERALRTFEVPGIAVAVVRDGKPVYSKGFGVRRFGAPDKVDENTLFQIGSTTKAFTVATMATLVDEGKLKWDSPVRDVMKTFEMYDPYVSREITVRDLLSHRSGIGEGEGDLLIIPPSTLTAPELVARMKYLKPAWGFRSHWAYCNICFIAAGELIHTASGQTWEEAVKTRILAPLGMNATRTSIRGLTTADNVASAHVLIEDKVTPVPWDVLDNAAPAGAIVSSVSDMSKWIAVQLAHGKIAGSEKRVFTDADSREMWTGAAVRTIYPQEPGMEATQRHFNEYGLGWFLWDYRGERIVEHAGGVTGMVTEVVLVPDKNFGFVVLANPPADGLIIEAVMYRVLDEYLGAKTEDWTTKYKAVQQKGLKEYLEARAAEKAARDANAPPSLPLEKYAGKYSDPWFGEAALSQENGKLVFTVPWSPHLTGDVEHWQHDTFVVHFRDKTVPDAYLYFSLNPNNSIERAKMMPVSSFADFSFDFQDLELKPVPPATDKK